MSHLRFPSLVQFNSVYARETWEGLTTRRTIKYRAKIKLHGTNAGIRVHPDGTTAVQGRNLDMTLDADKTTISRWFEPQRDIWAQAACEETLVFYGEWAGPGIGKGDAIQMTDKKRFFVFALGIGEAPHFQDPSITTSRWMITDPGVIAAFIPEGVSDDEVRVLPFEMVPFEMNFAHEFSIEEALKELNLAVDRVALKDPYVARNFGIEKCGEGYVLVQHADAPGRARAAARDGHRFRRDLLHAGACLPGHRRSLRRQPGQEDDRQGHRLDGRGHREGRRPRDRSH